MAASVLLVSCGKPGPSATQSSRLASAPRTSSQSSVSGARVQPPVGQNGVALRCTIPVALSGPVDPTNYRLGSPHGGFVSFPGGSVIEDAAGSTHWTAASESRIKTAPQPTLTGYGTVSYDSAAHRWVPVSRELVSPDGASYTYAEAVSPQDIRVLPTAVHVVTIATGADRVVYSSGKNETPILFAAEGIYLVTGRWEASTVGLRLLDPQTGAVRVFAVSGSWSVISGGAAWGIDASSGGVGSPGPGRLDRLDLSTGAVSAWYEVPSDRWVYPVGLDVDGAPIIATWTYGSATSPQVEEFYRLVAQSQVLRLFSAGVDQSLNGAMSDLNGLWFGSASVGGGLWFYSPSAGLQRVASMSSGPEGLRIDGPAGPCT